MSRYLPGPSTFWVTAVYGGTTQCGAVLTIEPGAIVLTPGRFVRAVFRIPTITHTDDRIKLVHSRWRPPWCNSFVVITDGKVDATAGTGSRAREHVRRALHDAGFVVDEVDE